MTGDPPVSRRSLDAEVAGGVAWTAAAKWASQLVTWASVLIAVRLLTPADFGVAEMSGAITNIGVVLAEFGIGAVVLQMRELDRRQLGQLNTVALLLGALFCAATAVLAPAVAWFFRTDRVTLLVIANGFGFIIASLQAIPGGLLQRDMDFRRLSLAETLQALLQAVVLVAAAAAGWGYWALFAGPAAGKTAAAALTMWWKPVPFHWPRRSDITGPLRFGWQIAVSRLAGMACTLSDVIVVGRLFGEAPVGLYRVASNIAAAPIDKVAQLILRVAGPLFARVQAEPEQVRRYFLILTETLALAIAPMTLGLALVAPEFVAVFIGKGWAGAEVPMAWLCAFMLFRTMVALISQVLVSLRYTGFNMWMSLLTVAVMPPAFVVAARWGIGAVAAAWIALAPVTVFPYIGKLLPNIGLRWRSYLAVYAPAALGCAAMTAGVWAAKQYLPSSWPPAVRLGAEAALGAAIYSAVLLGPYRERVIRYVRFLRERKA